MEKEKNILDYIKIGKNKVVDYFGKKSNKGMQVQQEQLRMETETDDKPFDYIGFQEKLAADILNGLKKLMPKEKLYDKRDLVIFMEDEELFRLAINHDLPGYVGNYIELRAEKLHSIIIRKGMLPAGLVGRDIGDGVQIAVINPEDKQKNAVKEIKKAVITMISEKSACHLCGDKVELIPEEGKVWNIGWGEEVEINNRPRTNHIALQYREPDNQDTDVYMISRTHAHIKYTNGYYFLYVESQGTRQADKRTKIERDGQVIELTDVNVGKPLRNKDIIRLNNEYLLFTLQ